MLIWYAAAAAAAVWAVFDSPSLDYRLVVLGAVVPVSEVALGRPGPMHSLVVVVVVLFVVMGLTRNRRLVRRRWLGVPIGMFAHLALSGVWTDTHAFWWPVGGLALSDSRPPELSRGLLTVVLELIGIGVAWWWYHRVGLDGRANRERFLRTGQLPPAMDLPG